MNVSPILEGACAALVAHLAVALLKTPPEKRIKRILHALQIVPVAVMFWGDNHGWPFGVRYFLGCLSAFAIMLDFCMKKTPPTRWEILVGIALPLFSMAFGLLDPMIAIRFSIPR